MGVQAKLPRAGRTEKEIPNASSATCQVDWIRQHRMGVCGCPHDRITIIAIMVLLDTITILRGVPQLRRVVGLKVLNGDGTLTRRHRRRKCFTVDPVCTSIAPRGVVAAAATHPVELLSTILPIQRRGGPIGSFKVSRLAPTDHRLVGPVFHCNRYTYTHTSQDLSFLEI